MIYFSCFFVYSYIYVKDKRKWIFLQKRNEKYWLYKKEEKGFMKNQKYRQWCNRKALLAGVLAVSMAVTPMTTAFAGTGAQAAVAQQDAEEASDEVVLADFDFNEAGEDGSFSGGNAIATVGGGSIELVDHDGGKAAKFVASDKD